MRRAGKPCVVAECGRPHFGKGLCGRHYQRLRKTGTLAERTVGPNTRYRKAFGTNEHVIIAARALGRDLPKGSRVHHVDNNGRNNKPSNLVICPDQAYHAILHARQRALDACGNASFRKCSICRKWGDPQLMYIRHDGKGQWHRACGNTARHARKRKHRPTKGVQP